MVALFLDPPIGGNKAEDKQRKIGFLYTWPGLWDPLRGTNLDHGDITVLAPADLLTIKLKFPREDSFGKVKLKSKHPERGFTTERTDESGLQEISWTIAPVARNDKYEFEVERTPAS